MKHLQNRATLFFGIPLAITGILLLMLNVFLVKKNADGDYIDNGLKYVTSSGSDEVSFTEKFEQYQDQGYIDSETITYEGEEVIKLREDLVMALRKISPKIDTDWESTLTKKVTDVELITELQQIFKDKFILQDSLKNVDKAIERHNQSRVEGRLIGSIILILFPIYVLPILISFFRLHSYRWPISIITVFTAWTGIGYVLMLTWSAWPKGKFS